MVITCICYKWKQTAHSWNVEYLPQNWARLEHNYICAEFSEEIQYATGKKYQLEYFL